MYTIRLVGSRVVTNDSPNQLVLVSLTLGHRTTVLVYTQQLGSKGNVRRIKPEVLVPSLES